MEESMLITDFLINLNAPALLITFGCLTALWIAYQKQVDYARENDKENIKVLSELTSLLDSLSKMSVDNSEKLTNEIKEQSKMVREHISSQIDRINGK